MKKSKLLFTIAIAFMFLGCSEKSVTHSEPKEEKSISEPKEEKSISEPKEEKSINESLAEDLLAEFQDNLGSWNACVVYDGKEYTSLDDFLNKDK